MPDRDSLVAAEMALQKAQLESDIEALGELLHEDLLFVSPGGILVGKDDDLRLHAAGMLKFRSSRAIELNAAVHGETGHTFALIELEVEADGDPVKGVYRYLRTWLFDNDRWQVVAGAVVPIGEVG